MTPLVLIGNTDPFDLDLLEEACRGFRAEVVTALDGAQVLDVVAREMPNLIVLDERFVEPNADEILQVLRRDTLLSRVPVLLGTANPDADPLTCLIRPYRVTQVQRAVRKRLQDAKDLRRKRRERQSRDTGEIGNRSQLLLTLDYELTQARRFRSSVSCISFPPSEGVTPLHIRAQLRAIDLVFQDVDATTIALLLDTDEIGAKTAAVRVAENLNISPASIGIASGPERHSSAALLLAAVIR